MCQAALTRPRGDVKRLPLGQLRLGHLAVECGTDDAMPFVAPSECIVGGQQYSHQQSETHRNPRQWRWRLRRSAQRRRRHGAPANHEAECRPNQRQRKPDGPGRKGLKDDQVDQHWCCQCGARSRLLLKYRSRRLKERRKKERTLGDCPDRQSCLTDTRPRIRDASSNHGRNEPLHGGAAWWQWRLGGGAFWQWRLGTRGAWATQGDSPHRWSARR